MSDVPVGLLFSGGVDSSLNAALFTRAAGAPVRTFTVGFQDTRLLEDERTTAAGMAAILGADHHEVQIGEREFLDFTDDIARVQDEPIADPVCVPLYFVTRLARATGTPVVHVGEGADETFCGYPRYREALARHRRVWQPLLHVPRPLVDATWRLAAAATSRRGPWAKGADLLRRRALGQEPFLSSAVAFYEIEKPPILAPAFQARCRGLDSFDAIRPHYRRLREMVPDATPLETMTYLELRLRLPELLLMRIDKVAMANSVEARAPFLDYQLVELALSLPESFKLEGGEPKAPLKRLAAQFLPASAIYQRKRGFGAPIQEWFRSLLGDRFRLALTAHREGLSQYFDVDELLARSRGPVPRVNDAFQLWTVFNFVKWYERFIA